MCSHGHIWTQTHTCVHRCVFLCMCAYVYMCKCVYVSVFSFIYVYECTHICKYIASECCGGPGPLRGQVVLEGFLHLRLSPIVQRLVPSGLGRIYFSNVGNPGGGRGVSNPSSGGVPPPSPLGPKGVQRGQGIWTPRLPGGADRLWGGAPGAPKRFNFSFWRSVPNFFDIFLTNF